MRSARFSTLTIASVCAAAAALVVQREQRPGTGAAGPQAHEQPRPRGHGIPMHLTQAEWTSPDSSDQRREIPLGKIEWDVHRRLGWGARR